MIICTIVIVVKLALAVVGSILFAAAVAYIDQHFL